MTTALPATAAPTVSTGCAGLDAILGGGLPRGRIYLVKGTPGVGKTTLALQFLMAGVALGETVLYITLSETHEELSAVAESHGMSLDGVSMFELNPNELSQAHDGQHTMFHPAEVELNEVMHTLLAEVERLQPARVVFDSLSEIRLLAQDPLRYRRQILALKQYFAGSDRTVLLLDAPSANADNHLESLAHGVIALERESPIYGGVRWRLEIAKLRGVKFRDGYHAYSIERGGLRVCPRLAAPAHSPSFAPGTLPTGVAKLDALLGGGVDWGTATLIVGPAGCGKSSLATQVILAGANAGQVGAMFTFEESPNTLFARAKSLGMPLQEQVDAGRVQVHRLDPAETSPGQFADDVRIAVERDNARVVVIDSLTGYLNAMPEERFLLNQLHELLIYLSHHGVVTILIATQHGIIGTDMASPIDVSYLADAVVMLRYFESAGRVRNAISIIKKRSGPHERTVRELALGPAGLVVGEPLHELQGVLTGVPTYSGRSEPLLGGLDGKSA